MKITKIQRLVCTALCLCVLLSCIIVPVSASEARAVTSENTGVATTAPTVFMPEIEDTVWAIDFTKVSSIPQSVSSDTYGTATISSSGSPYVNGKNGLTSNSKHFTFRMTESGIGSSKSMIDVYDEGCLMITAVVNFASLPTIIASSGYTNPLSLLKWERVYTSASGASTTDYGRLVCVDENGYLYDDSRTLMTKDVTIPAGRDVTLNVVLDTRGSNCLYHVFVDGVFAFSSSLKAIGDIKTSRLCAFDTQRSYSAHLKYYGLHTVDPSYSMDGVMTSDWAAYQIGLDADGSSYDLRLLSLMDTLKYAATGYEVIAAYRESATGEVKYKTLDMSSSTVFTSVEHMVGNVPTTWYASDHGGKYISALSINNIDASLFALEFCVRPYSEQSNGFRVYGDAKYMVYSGTESNGTPKFTLSDTPSKGTSVSVTEDTYIRYGSNYKTNYGSETELAVKYNNGYGTANSYNNSRMSFIKFDISDLPDNMNEYILDLYFSSGPSGSVFKLTEINPSYWSENSLTATSGLLSGSGIRSNSGWSTTFTYSANVRVDITACVLQAKASGKTTISFRIENEAYYTSYASMYSREYDNGSKAATITAGASMIHYSTNLTPYENLGYEPWGYAEMLVNDWATNIVDIYGRDYGKSTIVSSSVNGADYDTTIRVTSGSTPPAADKWSTVGTMGVRTVSSIDGYTALTGALLYDNYGGLASDGGKYYTSAYSKYVNGTKGYFGTYYDTTNDRWWFITPEGNRYIAVGMCSVNAGSTNAQKALAKEVYGDDWASWTADLFNSIGLNTTSGSSALSSVDEGCLISTHSGVGLLSSYASKLDINASIGGSTVFANNNTMNVFDPAFVTYAYGHAATQIGSAATSATKLGWTSDNEIPANSDMLDRYLSLDPSNPLNAFSYATAWTWLRQVTGNSNPSIQDAKGSTMVNMGGTMKEVSYRDLFRGFVYYRYYGIAGSAVKAAAPNQLYLGCRELGNNYQCETVMRVAGYFCDVLTVNLYLGGDPDASVVANLHKWACKPVYVTEFYAKSSGLNDDGEYVGTQAYGVWEVTYKADSSLTKNAYHTNSDGKTVYVDSTGIAHVYYIADGKTTYVDQNGITQTVPQVILTNNRGAGKVVQSQEARGQYYQTFALKMLESGYCVGWSWYRYQDNDVSLYTDADGNIILYNQWEKDVDGMTKVHKGEDTDQSNLDSNKGLVSNDMKVYTEFADAIAAITRNIYGLADYFDTTRRN